MKTALAPFWATLLKIGLLLILASGHTGHSPSTKDLCHADVAVAVNGAALVLNFAGCDHRHL